MPGFPFSNKNKMWNENVNPIPLKKYISGEKQITYTFTQNGIVIPVQFKFSRVCSTQIAPAGGQEIGVQY